MWSAIIQTLLSSLVMPILQMIVQNGLPADLKSGIVMGAGAVSGAALLHTTAPRNQGATIIPAGKV